MTGAYEVTQAVAVAEDGQLEHAPEALLHLRAAVRAGVPWHQALLQAVGLWTAPEEVYQDRTYLYLIQGEAFDWLVLGGAALCRVGRVHTRRRPGIVAVSRQAARGSDAGEL